MSEKASLSTGQDVALFFLVPVLAFSSALGSLTPRSYPGVREILHGQIASDRPSSGTDRT